MSIFILVKVDIYLFIYSVKYAQTYIYSVKYVQTYIYSVKYVQTYIYSSLRRHTLSRLTVIYFLKQVDI